MNDCKLVPEIGELEYFVKYPSPPNSGMARGNFFKKGQSGQAEAGKLVLEFGELGY